MAHQDLDVLMLGPAVPLIETELAQKFRLHRLWQAPDPDATMAALAPRLRAIAAGGGAHAPIGRAFMSRFPQLEIIASFGVGYDHVDTRWAAANGIVVTNTPDVLTEEVADTAVGLLLNTVRQLSQAERYLRAGRWRQENFPLTPATLRDRTIGIIGLGRIGKAIARRLQAFGVPIVYHGRTRQPQAPFRYYENLLAMAADVDTLIVVTPGGPQTRNLINGAVLDALGPTGILINLSRGSVVDEPALIAALKEKRLLAAGLDVFADEPSVPEELIAMEHVVLLPHVSSASHFTRNAMGQLVVDNLVAWAEGKGPLTPVPETPWPVRKT